MVHGVVLLIAAELVSVPYCLLSVVARLPDLKVYLVVSTTSPKMSHSDIPGL